jgi:hypothetical protein
LNFPQIAGKTSGRSARIQGMTIRFLLVLGAVIALVVDGLALLAGAWTLVTGLAVVAFALASATLAAAVPEGRTL